MVSNTEIKFLLIVYGISMVFNWLLALYINYIYAPNHPEEYTEKETEETVANLVFISIIPLFNAAMVAILILEFLIYIWKITKFHLLKGKIWKKTKKSK